MSGLFHEARYPPSSSILLQMAGFLSSLVTHSNVLAWRILGMGESGGLPSMRSQRVGPDRCDLAAVAAAAFGCESWSIKKAEQRRIDAFQLWCWRRLLRVPWTARCLICVKCWLFLGSPWEFLELTLWRVASASILKVNWRKISTRLQIYFPKWFLYRNYLLGKTENVSCSQLTPTGIGVSLHNHDY